jgi:hypothetical protein
MLFSKKKTRLIYYIEYILLSSILRFHLSIYSTWITIMKNENNFFLINKTWILTNAFKNKRVLRDKWIYKIKKNKRDEILRYKARWVIRDFDQIEKLNYTKIFAFVIKSMSYKVIYVITVVNDWKIEQMNVKIAFLYDNIEKDVYVV